MVVASLIMLLILLSGIRGLRGAIFMAVEVREIEGKLVGQKAAR